MAEGAEADGLLQRFQLLVWFDKARSYKWIDEDPDKAGKNQAFRIFEFFDQTVGDLAQVYCDADDGHDLPGVHFDADAHLFRAWLETLMDRVRSDDLHNAPAFQAHLAKYPSLVPSLALIFHLIDLASKCADSLTPITFDATALAISWADYLELHAHKLYALELNTSLASAHSLAEKIKTGEVSDRQKVSDIYRHRWPGLEQASEVEAALSILTESK